MDILPTNCIVSLVSRYVYRQMTSPAKFPAKFRAHSQSGQVSAKFRANHIIRQAPPALTPEPPQGLPGHEQDEYQKVDHHNAGAGRR